MRFSSLPVALALTLILAGCGTTEPAQGNRAPVANDDVAQTATGQLAAINVIANDSDPNGDDLDLVGVSSPAGGSVSIADAEAGVINFQAPATAGVYRFAYTVSDGRATGEATVTVTVR